MASVEKKRAYLYSLQNSVCWYCKRECFWQIEQKRGMHTSKDLAGLFTVEHIVPKAWGGTNAMANLVGACHECNQIRACSILDISQWAKRLAFLLKLHERHINSTRKITHPFLVSDEKLARANSGRTKVELQEDIETPANNSANKSQINTETPINS